VVNIDQRISFQREKMTPSVPVSGSVLCTRPIQRVPHMPGSYALPTGPPLSVIERPRCQHCQSRTILARIAAGPAGYELRTFACPKCDRFQRTLVVSDPMSGDARGWLRGELKSPH
jgi:hypothetical protein